MKWPNEARVSLATPARPMGDAAQPSARSDPLSTACYDNEVPQFVEAEIERRYGSLFSTLPHFRHTGKLTATVSTYATRRNGNVETVLLFDRTDKRVTVLNELIHVSKKEISEFVAFVFARYKSVSQIAFNAVTADLDGLPYPFQRFVCAEDIVITPPRTAEEYTARLAKNTRKSIRNRTNAILREHPGYTFSILPPEDVSEELIRRIIGFNKARMAEKERVSAYNEDESKWIVAVTRARGVVGVVTIDGQVCAGVVCCNVAGRYFMLVGAHDPAYDQFSLGTLSSYWGICECIERGATSLHLLWGRHPSKTHLCGLPKRFDRIAVFRSRVALLRNLDQVVVAAGTGYAREARLWLVNAEGEENLKGRMATRLWGFLRRAKRTFGEMKSKLSAR